MDDGEETEQVTAQSYGTLNTEAAKEECWLIRIPPKLAQLMEAVPEGTDLGELVFTKGGKVLGKMNPVKPSFMVHLRDDAASFLEQKEEDDKKLAASTASFPLNYSLQAMTKKIPLMHPFSRSALTGGVNITGKVTRTANLQVEQDSNYRSMLKDRLVATNVTSQRFVKPVEATESIVTKQQQNQLPSTSRGFGSAVLEFGKRKLELVEQQAAVAALAGDRQSKKARQFSPDQPLRSVAFELFSQQQCWAFKELKAAAIAGGASAQLSSKKSDTELRDILREIAVLHRSGDLKNMWELRKEYQQGASGDTGGN